MCIWGNEPIWRVYRDVPEYDPLTAYKVLLWDMSNKRFYSPHQPQAGFWIKREMHAAVSPLAVTSNNGVYCYRFARSATYAKYAPAVVVKLAIWGDVAQYCYRDGGKYDYKPAGFRAEHARVVGLVGPAQNRWHSNSLATRAFESACKRLPSLVIT